MQQLTPTMGITNKVFFVAAFVGLMSCGNSDSPTGKGCTCDTTNLLQAIRAKRFNRIPEYDTLTFAADSLWKLSAKENRRLWYRDIENPDSTKFTSFWNDYVPTNYHANHLDFVEYYNGSAQTEIAFQFGPNADLWAYHIFVVTKADCCYLATRSYFRHARFTYKAYAIITKDQVDSLFKVLEPINKIKVDTTTSWSYRGYFADNRNNATFYIDFENEMEADSITPKQEIMDLYYFVDKRIKWRSTYE